MSQSLAAWPACIRPTKKTHLITFKLAHGSWLGDRAAGMPARSPALLLSQPWIFGGGLSAVFDGSLFQMAALSNMRQTITNPANARAAGQILAPQIAKLATGYTHVFSPSTTFGKDLMPCSRVGIFTV